MIDCLTTHLSTITEGCYTFGTGPLPVLILGSCRIMPYVNYFAWLNHDNRYTIHVVDVVRFHYDSSQKMIELSGVLPKFETDAKLLAKLKSVRWFIHEHTANYAMFNTDRAEMKHIYQFGLKPEIDIAIPNFNNHFILFQDYVAMDKAIGDAVRASGGKVSPELQATIRKKGLEDALRFERLADLTNLPEFSVLFQTTWRHIRYWWTVNHISKAFTLEVFRLMNDKFLHLDIPAKVMIQIQNSPDMYAMPHTPVTQYDRDNYGIDWPEPTEPLKV